MEIVLIGNIKGVVGKTATTFCLANALKALGYRVLMVDFHPSGNLSRDTLPENPRYVLYDVFVGACPLEQAIYHTEIADILPTARVLTPEIKPEDAYMLSAVNNKSLSQLAERLIDRPGAEIALKSLLRSKKHDLASKYDFILIDTHSSDNILVTNAIVAADSVLITCEPSVDALNGIWRLISSINSAKCNYKNSDAQAQIDGIVITKYTEGRAPYRRCIQNIQASAKSQGIYLYETRMRDSSNILDAMENCRPIMDYIGTSGNGTADALNLALEFLAARNLEPKVVIPGCRQNAEGYWIYDRVSPMPVAQQESPSAVVAATPAAPAQPAPAKQSKADRPRSKEKMENIREEQQTVFRLKTEGHRLLKMACVVNGITMTDFLEGVCLDALHHGYRCRNAACNCEFIFRSSSADTDVELCCPACGGKKLDKVFKL